MMARPILTPPDLNPEGLQPGEWVKMIGYVGVGHIISVSNDHAYVDWLNGSKAVIGCIYLRRVPSGEGKDGVRPE